MSRWIDLSGAPPLLIPEQAVSLWRGIVDPKTGKFSELNLENPLTDYDRACVEAWPGKGLISVGPFFALALYSEFDLHSWNGQFRIVGSGGWWPSQEKYITSNWGDPLCWHSSHTEYLLINSAVNGADQLLDEDCIRISLPKGRCIVEYAVIEAERVGSFYRFNFQCN